MDDGINVRQLGVLRKQMALGARVLSVNGHDDFNQGQISARIPESDYFLIKGAVVGFEQCTPESMVVCPVNETEPLDDMAPPETCLHQAIYQARPDVMAIVHSHPKHALVFGATHFDIKPISHDGAYFTNRVNRFEETTNTVLNIDTARQVAAALGENPALFLCNHGVAVVSSSVRNVVVLSIMLERSCELQIMAQSIDPNFRYSPAVDVGSKREFVHSDMAIKSYWQFSTNSLARSFPECAAW